jgi:type II secretory pathway pseudopilin PulG
MMRLGRWLALQKTWKRPMQRSSRARIKASGHSYLELIVVVLVMGIATKIALPRYVDSMRRYQLEAAAKRVAADLELARDNAKTRGTTQQVVFTLASSSYSLTGADDPSHAGRSYTVNLATGDYPATISQLQFGSSGNGGTIAFDMYGRPDYAGSVTLRLGTSQKVVSVDAWGKLTVN